jgi:hypothetical protein
MINRTTIEPYRLFSRPRSANPTTARRLTRKDIVICAKRDLPTLEVTCPRGQIDIVQKEPG